MLLRRSTDTSTEVKGGRLADFGAALYQTVQSLYYNEARLCDFNDVYVENKLVEDLELSWHAIRAPSKPRVHFVLKDSVASLFTVGTQIVSPTTMTHNGLSIEERVNFTTATATSVDPNVGDQLVTERLPIAGAQTAACKPHCDVVTFPVLQKVLLGNKGGAPLFATKQHLLHTTYLHKSPPSAPPQIQTSDDKF